MVALIAGLLLGGISAETPYEGRLAAVAGTVGGLWLDALKMVVIRWSSRCWSRAWSVAPRLPVTDA